MRKTDFPVLYPIIDVEAATGAGWTARDLARAYMNGGARVLQLRGKNMESGLFFELASTVVEDAQAADAVVIVNDRADIAVLSRAGGVHVGQQDLSPSDVRRVTGPDATVGLSTHTSGQIERAVAEPISYVAIGPVFSTRTKNTGYEGVGLKLVAEAGRRGDAAGLPVVAIGGITLATASEVIAAGATSVAVIGDLLNNDPEARVRQYLAVLM